MMNVRTLLVAGLVALATLPGAPLEARQGPAAACTTPTPECTEWVAVGSGRSLVYRTHSLDRRNESITHVVVMVHGAGRNADDYFTTAAASAFVAGALETSIVISPRMASNNGQGCSDALDSNEISWNCSTWRSGGPALSHPEVTSFDFLDEILRKVARREIFPNLRSIVVTGHSAGGQVTNRYQMSSRVHDSLGIPVTYVVSNPSSYAYPGPERPTPAAWSLTANAPGYIPRVSEGTPTFRSMGGGGGCSGYDQWPYGFQNRTGYSADQSDEQLRRQIVARPLTYLMGEVDILPLSGFDSGCQAMAQGPTRLARSQAFARYVNERLGGAQEVVVVVGCGHNNRCIYTSDEGVRLLFPGM